MSKHNGCDCEICKRHRRWDAALDELRSCVNDAESSWECEVTDRDMDLLNIAQELGLDGFNKAEVIARIKAMRERITQLEDACREFVRFAEMSNPVDRGDYIRYQVKAIGAAKDALAALKAEGEVKSG